MQDLLCDREPSGSGQILLSGEQFSTLLKSSKQWLPNKPRKFQDLFRKNAKLRNLSLECVALQFVLLFRAALASRHADHADDIVNGTIQEVAIHSSKSIHRDYESVRKQITARVEVLANRKDFRSEEILAAFSGDSTLGMHAAAACKLLKIEPLSPQSITMMLAEQTYIFNTIESKAYEAEVERSAPSILLSQIFR